MSVENKNKHWREIKINAVLEKSQLPVDHLEVLDDAVFPVWQNRKIQLQ